MRILKKSIRGMALAIIMLYLLSGLGVCTTNVIDFENAKHVTSASDPSFHTINWVYVNNQYSNLGVEFNQVTAIDFSEGMENFPGDNNMPHSGTVAVEKGTYLGLFNHTDGDCDPIEIYLPQAYRIKVWVGIDGRAQQYGMPNNVVIMSAYDNTGNLVGQTSATITQTLIKNPGNRGPQFSFMPTPIRTPLEIKANYQAIAKVTIGFDKGCNAGLAIDDVEFDTAISTQTNYGGLAGGGAGSAYHPPGYRAICGSRYCDNGQPVNAAGLKQTRM
jgi:hypothetical protein